MRSTIILLVALAVSMSTAHAQNQPSAVTAAFAKAYPNAKGVKWDKEGDRYEASFRQNGNEISVVYNANGIADETETAISTNELPKKAQAFVSAKGKVKDATKIVLANGSLQYEAEVNSTDYIFDANGNLLKEKKKNEKEN